MSKCLHPFELKGVKCNRSIDISNTVLCNSLKQTENCKRLIDQGSLKSYLKEKECIRKRNSRNVIRQAESVAEKENRLAKERDFKRTQRKNESIEAKEKRLAKQRSYGKNLSPEAREKRLDKQRSNRQNESSEGREKRLAKQRSTNNTKNESLEAREKRLAKQRSNRQSESSEVREKRLAKQRSYRENEFLEAREKKLAKQRSNRLNKSKEEKEKRAVKQRAYRKLVKETKAFSFFDNNYNSACLHALRANMDIQVVLDVYACAMYIVSYISKAQNGMSELLRKTCAEAREGNANIKQQVRDIGNKFLNSVEISAQEAVYIILQLPMRKSSRNVIFINISLSLQNESSYSSHEVK